ncbi:hypothetical protein GLOTRDRAFT_116242 [Gloeophyllum trabeum ATCC 11539]|uniref:Methyltransferase domain-containing protein n=1 Tax=Gloeophyllum trabeum (strain ATCC 11539 / FP-39264 / Madison 617) TaxID=670483 RepID=S7Q708_GLOTA|nr:uncharacterized protein GLOTRDRAFT_116242 [Gloeophyllum trabeum ATCC 11539]EPQ55307.1 hypothetical protein GLOTRDRAFT_116242 [Gloeophyllum trabeum ATCC 11539]
MAESTPPPPDLDPSIYSLDEHESAFFKSQTGIPDDEELKKHILKVQEKAYKVYPYPCIRRFAFASLKISRLPAYERFLQLGKERNCAIFLDIGCCFGNDARKAIDDGYPLRNVIASDLRPEFWELGHELFRSTPEPFPVPFIPGDVFDPAFLQPAPVVYSPPSTPVPDLSSLTSLTPLIGHISAIHASAFFHLFNEQKQFELAQKTASLLSPEPGSMIFGSHVGLPHKGLRTRRGRPAGAPLFTHSPESWRELWDGHVFDEGKVRVKAELKQVERPDLPPGDVHYLLVWSVTRL